MALVCTKLTNHALDTAHLAVNNFILPYNPQDEKSVRTIVRNFLKKNKNAPRKELSYKFRYIAKIQTQMMKNLVK